MRTRIDYSCDTGAFAPYHKLYGYDSLLRMTEEHKRLSSTNATAYRYGYSFDDAGNRTQLVKYNGATTATTSYTVNDFNQLTNDGQAYLYDDNGNCRQVGSGYGGRYYTHDRWGRLASVATYGHVYASYFYDPFNRLILRDCVGRFHGQVLLRRPVGRHDP